ncbi:MAG: hypothetical protein ACXVXW_04845 [Mycobacteriaceae bacterium]
MTREWKPGDVALVKVKKSWHRAIRDQVAWVVITDDSGVDHLETCAGVDYEARPLVVIDPKEHAYCERLMQAMREPIESTLRVSLDDQVVERLTDHVCNAILSLLPTPKPDEPTGLGAVVEDADGVLWVRVTAAVGCPNDPWKHSQWREGDVQPRMPYAGITAVRVLSEGVTQ